MNLAPNSGLALFCALGMLCVGLLLATDRPRPRPPGQGIVSGLALLTLVSALCFFIIAIALNKGHV